MTESRPPDKVMLRSEVDGADRRYLWAYVDSAGHLHIDGQDLGPATAMVSDDGEYEWFHTFAATNVPRVVELLGGTTGDDVLAVLQHGWTGARSYDLEALLRDSDIPSTLDVWSG